MDDLIGIQKWSQNISEVGFSTILISLPIPMSMNVKSLKFKF